MESHEPTGEKPIPVHRFVYLADGCPTHSSIEPVGTSKSQDNILVVLRCFSQTKAPEPFPPIRWVPWRPSSLPQGR
jgi:hypothetical protein